MASVPQFDSIEKILQKLPPEDYQQVRNVIYGKATDGLPLPEAESEAREHDLELVSCRFSSAREQLRVPNIVRVGLFQHKLPLATNAPIKEQRDALYKLAEKAIGAAARGGVNVFCFQEAWSEFLRYVAAMLESNITVM